MAGLSNAAKFWEIVNRRSDLLLAAGVVAILAMLIVPLPTAVLDVLLATNICISATILMVALYVPEASRLASFPTILLLTTLFRLALNVSSTRLILLYAFAGHIIEAFGNFVVQGNYVVGAVIFLILTIIQFIVITKGAERVAEVGARFTLDAMPGKQMSIDADMRNGLIGQEEAKTRRRALEKESQFYGAMDGAMKFVKGDAIAGIIITLINVIAGLIIGVMQLGMSVGEAAQVYSLLTIGDGLVSQIPALLTCVAAGLVTTRVAGGAEKGEGHVAKDIFEQILAQPRALALVSVLMLAMLAVPGFPKPVFIALSLITGLLSFPRLLAKPSRALVAVPGAPTAKGALPAPAGGAAPSPIQEQTTTRMLLPHPLPVVLELHPTLTPLLQPGDDPASREAFTQELQRFRDALYAEMGVQYPAIRIRGNCQHLPQNGYSILVYEAPVANSVFPPNQALLMCDERDARGRGVEATPAKLPWSHQPAGLIPAERFTQAQSAGLPALSARDVILQHLAVVMRRHSAEFLGIQETQALLDNLQQQFPTLVQEVIPRVLTKQQVANVLQRLLQEEVPVRDLRRIMESLARWSQTDKDPAHLAELVRRDLRRALSHRHSGGLRTLQVLLVDPQIEQIIRESVVQYPSGAVLSLSPEISTDIMAAIGRALHAPRNTAQLPVILTEPLTRPFLRKLVEWQYPEIAVLSYDELSPDVRVKSLARVALDGAAAKS